jgi:hypothetical protein
MNKKLFANASALVLLTLALLGSVYAQSDSPACNNRLIAGNYWIHYRRQQIGRTRPHRPNGGRGNDSI